MPFARATAVLPLAEVGIDTFTDQGLLLDLAADSTPYNARRMRVHFQDWLRRLGVTSPLIEQLALAVYEALANVVDHAYHADHPDPVMRLQARLDDDQVLITVTDHGRWRTPQGPGIRGRGLAMMRSCATEVHLHPTARGTTVQLRAHTPIPKLRVSLSSR